MNSRPFPLIRFATGKVSGVTRKRSVKMTLLDSPSANVDALIDQLKKAKWGENSLTKKNLPMKVNETETRTKAALIKEKINTLSKVSELYISSDRNYRFSVLERSVFSVVAAELRDFSISSTRWLISSSSTG